MNYQIILDALISSSLDQDYWKVLIKNAYSLKGFEKKSGPLSFYYYSISEYFCQESKLSEVIINIAEDLAASESDQEAAAAYIDLLYELAENPVNLNSANEDEIARLFFLSDFQVKALADYAHSTGRIISFNELAIYPRI